VCILYRLNEQLEFLKLLGRTAADGNATVLP